MKTKEEIESMTPIEIKNITFELCDCKCTEWDTACSLTTVDDCRKHLLKRFELKPY